MNMSKEIRWQQRFDNFSRAYSQLSTVVERVASLSDLEKEGMIQRFEYTFELAWKTLKDYLASQAVEASFPREVIKQGFHYDLIDNGEIWMDMLTKRNVLAHTYNEENFRQAVDLIVHQYFSEMQKLHTLLHSRLESKP